MAEEQVPDPQELQQELERCRAMLLQSAKMAELGRQVASLIHEISQPLLGIKAFAQMLKSQLEGDETAQRRAAFIEEQAIVLEKLAGRLRRYSRQQESAPGETAHLPEAVQTVVRMIAHRLRKVGVQVEIDFPQELPGVRIGQVHAQQLLVNLLTNASDALEGLQNKRVLVRGRVQGQQVVLCVADSGAGIPPEVRDRIFEPFFTTKDAERGTGLGLPICLEIVKAHGGSLTVTSGDEVAAIAGEGMRTAIEIALPAVE